MSYILDALVKADLERQRQEVPGLHTVHGGPSPKEGMYLRWPAGGIGMMLAAGLLFLAWDRPWQGPGPAATPPAEQELRLPAPMPPVSLPSPAQAGVQATPPGAAMPSRPLALAREVRREATAGSRIETAAEERKSRPDSRLYGIAELPPALQKEARSIMVAGFAQASDAGERMAIINDRAWREGDEVTTGLKVERISNDGVIFNFKGYRFRKGGS